MAGMPATLINRANEILKQLKKAAAVKTQRLMKR
jgi:DNA mismatch repair ATPase MutS